MKIGVIGVGVIGKALVEGFCYQGDREHELFVSPRSKSNVDELKEKYSNVTICNDNQMVLDKSEYVFISILPKLGESVLRELNFKYNHKIINLMSTIKLGEIQSWIGETSLLVHIIPLSFISKRSGPIAVFPENKEVINLLEPLGQVIGVCDKKQIEVIAAITGLMTTYYKLLNDVSKFGETFGLSREVSVDYTSHFFEALSKHAREADLESLSTEMTPGGFNELALENIDDSLDLWTDSLKKIMSRFD